MNHCEIKATIILNTSCNLSSFHTTATSELYEEVGMFYSMIVQHILRVVVNKLKTLKTNLHEGKQHIITNKKYGNTIYTMY